MDLQNKTALVVGGGSGIGLGIAVALAEEGCRVAVADCNAQGLARAAAAYTGWPAIVTHPCNVTVRGDCAALADWAWQQLGRLDIVVNTAGINVARRKMCELDPADFDRIMSVNCTGFYNVLHAKPAAV
jgi:NAD(P)-dependent dehydrogenase (short-subunit alcohol dehydrogenase family)